MIRNIKMYLVVIVCAMTLLVACSSKTATNENTNKNTTSTKQASVDPLQILQKAQTESAKWNTITYEKKYHTEDLFTTNGNIAMKYVRNLDVHTDWIKQPHARHTTQTLMSTFLTPGVNVEETAKPSDWKKYTFEDYDVDGINYFKESNQGWIKSFQIASPGTFYFDMIDQIISADVPNGIKLVTQGDQYQLTFPSDYFNQNSSLFEYYKKNYDYQKFEDSVASELKKTSGETILYNQAMFKSPTITIIIDKNTMTYKEIQIQASIRIPTSTTEVDKKGNPIHYPPVNITEMESYYVKGQFTGSIEVPDNIKNSAK